MRTKALFGILAILVTTACAPLDKQEIPPTSEGYLRDFSKGSENLTSAQLSTIKSERILRKLRLSSAILAKKFDIISPSLSSCVEDTELNNGSEWRWSCGDTTSGKSYFSYSAAKLNKVHLEVESQVEAYFGTTREILEISEVVDSRINNKRTLSFRIDWKLYKGHIANNSLDCVASSTPIKMAVGERKVVDGDLETTEYFLESMTFDRLTLNCAMNPMFPGVEDTFIEFKNAALSVQQDSLIQSGSFEFHFNSLNSNPVITNGTSPFKGTMILTDSGVKGPKDSRILAWDCEGNVTCFP